MKKNLIKYITLATALFCGACASVDDTEKHFPLPDILVTPTTKTKITTAQDWNNIARPEILDFFKKKCIWRNATNPKEFEV